MNQIETIQVEVLKALFSIVAVIVGGIVIQALLNYYNNIKDIKTNIREQECELGNVVSEVRSLGRVFKNLYDKKLLENAYKMEMIIQLAKLESRYEAVVMAIVSKHRLDEDDLAILGQLRVGIQSVRRGIRDEIPIRIMDYKDSCYLIFNTLYFRIMTIISENGRIELRREHTLLWRLDRDRDRDQLRFTESYVRVLSVREFPSEVSSGLKHHDLNRVL